MAMKKGEPLESEILAPEHDGGNVKLLFTDSVRSTALKQQLGEKVGAAMINLDLDKAEFGWGFIHLTTSFPKTTLW